MLGPKYFSLVIRLLNCILFMSQGSAIVRLLSCDGGRPHLVGKRHPRNHFSPGSLGSQTPLPHILECRRLCGCSCLFRTRKVSIEFSMAYWVNHCQLLRPPARRPRAAG